MAGELWEIVRADELKVGDVVLDLRGGAIDSYEIDPKLAEIAKNSPKNFYPAKVRRYTGPSPDVLMRALKLAEKNSTVEDSFGRMCQGPLAEDYIRQAEAELAKEREA